MKLLLLAATFPCVLLSACVDGGDHGGRASHRGPTLPNDAYYVGVPLPFRTVADCVAGGTTASACTNTVALCASGSYGVRHGDVVTTGRYQLDHHHALGHAGRHDDGDDPDEGDDDHDAQDGEHVHHDKAASFDFDVEGGQLLLDPAGTAAMPWQPDTGGVWKTTAGAAADCAARPDLR